VVLILRTVDREIMQAHAARDGGKCASVATRKVPIEVAHEALFLPPLLGALRHARVEIPDVPTIGDRHMAGIRFAVDEYDAVFAEPPVGTRIVDKAGDEKRLLASPGKVSRERGATM